MFRNVSLANFVSITYQDNQIVLAVYHDVVDMRANCFCKYDVNFKMSKLYYGNYQLKVYDA